MAMEKQSKLASLLIKKTDEEVLNWEKTLSDDVFAVSFARYTAQVRERADHDNDSNDIVIDILNDEGTVVETFSDVELAQAESPSAKWYTRLKRMYDKARRKALGSDKAIDDILYELDDEMPF